jgi:hypothetical protein
MAKVKVKKSEAKNLCFCQLPRWQASDWSKKSKVKI